MPPLSPTPYIRPFCTRKSMPIRVVSPLSPTMSLTQLFTFGLSVVNMAIWVPSPVIP
jgi:hypothetical protein